MIASSKSSGLHPTSLLGYVSIGKAASILGVSVQSLRAWERSGLVRAYRTCGGHGQRRYNVAELKQQVLGISPEKELEEGKKVCVYVRVSTAAQQREGNLQRQLNRMLETVSAKEGIEKEDILVFKDSASAFGSRDGLNSMVDALIAGRLAKIYVEHADRLSRVPALTRLLEHLAKKSGTLIVALDRDETVDEMKNAMLELVEFCTVLANRTNARKQAERRKKVLGPNTLDFIRREIASGRGIKDAVVKANQAGYTTEKGERITYRVVQRYLSKVVDRLLPVDAAHNTFEEFVGKHLKRKKGSKVQAGAIHSAYNVWCKRQGILPISSWKCGQYLRNHTSFKPETWCGYCWFGDVEIIDFPSVYDAKGEWAKKYDNGIRGEMMKYLGRKGNRLHKRRS